MSELDLVRALWMSRPADVARSQLRPIQGDELTEEELVELLWRLAPVGSKLAVMPLRTWVLSPSGFHDRDCVLVANHRLPDHLLRLQDEDPEGFTRALGRLAYGDEGAFTPE